MVLKGWLFLVLPTAVFVVHAQDATGTCNSALGLSSGTIKDGSISSHLGEGSTPAAGRLNNKNGAWCFDNDSIKSHEAILIIDLGNERFVSGFGVQGPPESIHPKTYTHVVSFATAFSLDSSVWEDFNGGSLFFDTDKNDTSDDVRYYVSNTVELTRYVKVNVTYQVSGSSTTVCFRFEIYGCDTDILPSTSVEALTTPKGKIEVNWIKPSVITSLESDSVTIGILSPNRYSVRYRPTQSETFATVATGERMVSLEDVRLGATYVIQLQCHYPGAVVSCGSTQIEAYPPCPEEFTGGNEYHCFMYLKNIGSIEKARLMCLNSQFDHQIGGLGYFVDEEERRFVVSRILPKNTPELYLIGEECQDNEGCCKILRIKDGNTLEEVKCLEESLTDALCLRDHKGEGAKLRVSSVAASEDGSTAMCTWRYEGLGWKTDELQVKMWTSDEENNPSTFTFSTLSNTFEINTGVGVMYFLLLRPAPNIRTEEFVYKFIIIDFQNSSPKYGALLTPVTMSIYIIWSGSIRVTWDGANAVSKSGKEWLPNKYSIAHQKMNEGSMTIGEGRTEVEVASGREFVLTPIAMSSTYVFEMACFFVDDFHPCGQISIKTDPPNLVLPKSSKLYVIYEVIADKMKNWADAEDDCQQRAGHLTSLLDEEEAKALLKMLPNPDSKIWTGAKLGKTTTGHWTDGQKITNLPMAQNSGVTSSSESCCRAINEMGKLKLTGGDCKEKNPYICKYSVEEILTLPGGLTTSELTWNFFKLSWSKPTQRWLPTFYNARACLIVSPTNCVKQNNVNGWGPFDFGDLLELREYKVEVEAVLQPVDIKIVSNILIITYPKSPLKVSISPKGQVYVNTPILTAMGFPKATVAATLYQMDLKIDAVTGGVKDLAISGIVPEETYKLMVKQDGGAWTQEISFPAEPTCFKMDAMVNSICYSLVEEPLDFNGANKLCSEKSVEKMQQSLWMPNSEDQLKEVVVNVGPYTSSWVQKPAGGSISNIGSDASCSKGGDSDCCFYDPSSSNVKCSSCCDEKKHFICSYKVNKSILGEVDTLSPDFIGNTSIRVQWLPPKDIFWSIRRFEVEWIDNEKSALVGKDMVVGVTEKLMEELEYGTEYDIKVTPLGASKARGDSKQILITTLDPRTQVLVFVDSDGGAKVYSPLLIEKGRGSEQVDVKLFQVEPSGTMTLLKTASGEVQGVYINELEVGQQYKVEMTPKVKGNKMFNYSHDFFAYPTCQDNQIQDGLVCIWAPPESKSWTEAYQVCRGENGELLDFKTQGELSQPIKALLTSKIHTRFWLDMGDEGMAQLKDASSFDCTAGEQSDVMCCTYEVSKEGELNDLKCTCCNEPRPFACKKTAKLSLGDIGEVSVQDVEKTSFKVIWTMASESKWQKTSFEVKWSEDSSRKRRAVEDKKLVIDKAPAEVTDLKPGTKYNVAVAPYTDATKSSGNYKETTVTTSDDVNVAGLMDGACTVIALKISCCISVILGTAFTVFVFIATRMFYLDCVAQMFQELATLGAYICILISSAQSYNNDSECVKAHPTLCVAVAVLIQFFFQVIYMFYFMESLLICSYLKNYLPECCTFRSLLVMSFGGFGIPAVMMIILAAVASNGFSDDTNCWLDLKGDAMLPSVIPVIIFGSIGCLLLLSVFDADEPKEELFPAQKMRGRIFLKTRYGCFLLLAFTTVCYCTGMIGVNNRDATLNYVFVGFSFVLGILIPFIRIRFDDEVREQLKRGLFSSLKDDMGAIRVSPAPNNFDPDPLLPMSEIETRRYKRRQLEELKAKELNNTTETVWHQ